ncbi:hypothetical protein [Pseudomonas sp. IT-P4]|uniref:hypothetical protein n=1 Tax=Pseudomonas sp. IT-P4 TaxID=3026446 RepID=UPI0039E09608
MENNSIDDMLVWLEQEQRTLKWDAILAYDRTKTNAVLLQEYIARFSAGDYMEPITEEIEDNTTPTQKEYITDYVMDRPRLSFVNSSLENSKAKLSMKVIGGSHLTYSKPEGASAWSVSKIALEDALDGPRLEFNIDLRVAPGSVTSAGQVELKLDAGTDYRLTYVETPHLQRVAGERMKRRFSALPESQKTFVLNQLEFTENQFLKPKNFVIRTHNKKGSGARLLANEDENEGAVLLLITMEGGVDGLFPGMNSDLRYLLPDGYSATVLLGQEYITEKIFSDGLKKMSSNLPAQFETVWGGDGKRITKLVSKQAYRRINQRRSTDYAGARFTSPYIALPMPLRPGSPDSFFEMRLANDSIYFDWTESACGQSLDWNTSDASEVDRLVFSAWFLNIRLIFSIDSTSQMMKLNVDREASKEDLRVSVGQLPLSQHHIDMANSFLVSLFEDDIFTAYLDFISPVEAINILTLNSLLFRSGDAVKYEHVHLPTDLALFGQVGPTQTAFTVSPLETVLGHSGEFQFKTEPVRTGVTWKVENIPGSTGNPGTINTSTGLYKAPTAAQLEGDHTRVKVTATAGTHTSSALVAVLRRDITINPLVQTATAGDPRGREMSAGTLDGGALRWSVDPASGARVEPSLEPEGDHTYYPGPLKPKTGFHIDRIEVTNPRSNKTEYSTVLVIHGVPVFTVIIDKTASLPANKVQLAVVGTDGNPIAPGVIDLTWEVLAGSGQVDQKSGVFTVDPAGVDKFAAIITTFPSSVPDFLPDSQGYIILPMPLFSIPETIRMLSVDGQ